MKREVSQILSASLLLLVAIAFQNCGQVKFADTGSVASKSGGEPGLPTEPSTPMDPSDPKYPPHKCPNHGPNDPSHPGYPNHDYDHDSLGICILDKGYDNGKAIKVGLDLKGKLAGVHAMSDAICMTEKSCLEIIDKKLNVQEFRDGLGVCSGNPNVHHIPKDSDIQALVDSL
jgi:hypothetical protein